MGKLEYLKLSEFLKVTEVIPLLKEKCFPFNDGVTKTQAKLMHVLGVFISSLESSLFRFMHQIFNGLFVFLMVSFFQVFVYSRQ